MVNLAGASAPLIFLISMVGMVATASTLAQFASVYPSAGSFITYITRAISTKVAVGVITILGYIIAFGGIYILVGSYIVQNVFGDPHVWGLTQLVTIAYGVLVVAPVVVGLRFGVRVTVVLYAFEVILLLLMSITILVRGGHDGLSATPFYWPGGSTDVLLTFSLAVLAFGGFEAAATLAEETQNPRRNVPIAVIGAVIISGIIYVVGSYALVTAFGVGRTSVLAADANPFHTAGSGRRPPPRSRSSRPASRSASSPPPSPIRAPRPASCPPTGSSAWSSCTWSRTSPSSWTGPGCAAAASARAPGCGWSSR
jgi:amino acid transporter